MSTSSVSSWSQDLIQQWIGNGPDSFLCFEGLLRLLEIALEPSTNNYSYFSALMESVGGGGEGVVGDFLSSSLPYLIDSDFLHHTDYVDLLLLYLTIYQVNTGNEALGKEFLDEFVGGRGEFGGFYLRQHGKHFEELFSYIHSHHQHNYDPHTTTMAVEIIPHYLHCMHFPSKKVIVSNAPPVKLKRRRLITREKFECQESAGGLVSGIKPSLEKNDVWVSYLDTKLMDLERMPRHVVPRMIRESVRLAPKIRRSTSLLRYTFRETNEEDYHDFLYEKTETDFLSLQRRLERFAEKNFVVNPLIIMKEDHEGFYNGISNGLFWPAFHNLPQYIIHEYTGPQGRANLDQDWQKYIKVNFHFAIHAARSGRQQDFIWIHDYHLFLVGGILRSLDASLNSAFFLHIPFRLSDSFMHDFPQQGRAILTGLLGFTQVGFQSNKDTLNFIRLVQILFPHSDVECRDHFESLHFTIKIYKGNRAQVTDVGTFPISIKTDRLLDSIQLNDAEQIKQLKKSIMGKRTGKMFLSVERFDYTKGLLERFDGIERYLENHPERVGEDLFYQIAATSRTDVSSYRQYQKKVMDKLQHINNKYGCGEHGPIVHVDETNHPQEEVIRLYMAADVVVVTPVADGMNLVIKEAILANPNALLILSTGAGAENQLFDAGLGDCYLRIPDVEDTAWFSETLHRAVTIPESVIRSCGEKLFEYTKTRDIDHWISSFTSPDWTHNIMDLKEASQLCKNDFPGFLERMDKIVGKAVRRMNVDYPVGSSTRINLRNAIQTLEVLEKFDGPPDTDKRYPLMEYKKELKRDLLTVGCVVENQTSIQLYEAYKSVTGDECRFQQDVQELTRFFWHVCPVTCVVVQADEWLLSEFTGYQQSLTSGFLVPRFLSRIASHLFVLSNHLSASLLTQKLNFLSDYGVGIIPTTTVPVFDTGTEVPNVSQLSLNSIFEMEIEKQLGPVAGESVLFLGGNSNNDRVMFDYLNKKFKKLFSIFVGEEGFETASENVLLISSIDALYPASVSQILKPVMIEI